MLIASLSNPSPPPVRPDSVLASFERSTSILFVCYLYVINIVVDILLLAA